VSGTARLNTFVNVNLFCSVAQIFALTLPRLFASNDVVRSLSTAAIKFLLHAAPQLTRGGVLRGTLEKSMIVESILKLLKYSSSNEANSARNLRVTSLSLQVLTIIVDL
jgi:hypothetical protein